MEETIINLLDLTLAWERMKLDRQHHRVFYTHPRLFDWIQVDLDGWLSATRQRLRDGYTPHTSMTCYVPKAGWLVRPGTVLDGQDELIFNALIGTLYKNAYDLLGDAQGDPDIAYQIQKDSVRKEWILSHYSAWTQWRTKSALKLKKAQFVVLADIAGFYENIDLQRLSSDLKPLFPEPTLLQLLMAQLNKWAQPRAKGIPQGFSAADILAKVYLNPIDRRLRNEGFTHLRYVDDIRIFCKSKLDAKRALLLLNELMGHRGLNLQTAKTKIIRADEAVHEIDGVTPLIQTINSELATELHTGDSYVTVDEIEKFFNEDPSTAKPEVLERAFSESFGTGGERFNKTLLHYLLNRLGKTNSSVAVSYAVDLLQERPEETEHTLRYLGQIGVDEQSKDAILEYMASPEAIYDYQLFQVVAWFMESGDVPLRLVALCRTWNADKNRKLWLRAASRAVLGKYGDQSDLEVIESSYDNRLGETECADIVDSLARMEAGRRNSFFGRIGSDGDLVNRAIKHVRRRQTKT
jgi:hypothetical protein